MRVLLVGNPAAHSGKAAERIAQAQAAMEARGWHTQVQETLPDGRTVPILVERLRSDPVDRVVYLGGDGTFAEVAKAVMLSDDPPAMGLLPSGTANDQGKSFGISSSPAKLEWNLDVLEAGHLTHLDVGRVGRLGLDGQVDALEMVFHSIGWGMQPDILKRRNTDKAVVSRVPLLREIYRDQAVYAGATLQELLASWVEPIRFDAHLVVDGRELVLEGLTDLIVNATPVYGGMWVLDRDAEPDDGRFEIVAVRGRREWAQKGLRDLKGITALDAPLAFFDQGPSAGIQCSELKVELVRVGREQVRSQIDGEEWLEGTRFMLSVLDQKLDLVTPAEWVPPWKD